MDSPGSPGSNPHADRPNWRPAETYEEYVFNCREGLEEWSERRLAKIFGMSRVHLWRCKMMAQIPDDLFEWLVKRRPIYSTKMLAAIGYYLGGDDRLADIERCLHCGEVLRARRRIPKDVAEILAKWGEKGFEKPENKRLSTT
jgi:hypothetical protein